MRRFHHYTISSLLAVCLLAGILAGCAATPAPAATKAVEANSTTMSETIQITDAAGRTVEFARLPQRIVVVGRGPYMALHLLYMFPEASERLVGVEKKGTSASDFLPFVDATFESKAMLGGNPGPEQIAALKPDVVIMKGITEEQMSESLGKVGIPVVYVGLETPELFFSDVKNMGAILGNTARADQIIDYYQSQIERVAQVTQGIAADDRPRVLLIEYSDRGGKIAVQVPAMSWIQTQEVQLAGGAPIWKDAVQTTDGWTVVNFEQIASWNPDKIFVVIWYTLDPTEVIASLKADPQWSSLKAVQNGELYAFPGDIFGWDSPEPRWVMGMTWLATRIYPDAFADVDMSNELYTFFGEMFGMERQSITDHIMPRVRMDVK
jgi:iron complex transport system substrate-binding protein